VLLCGVLIEQKTKIKNGPQDKGPNLAPYCVSMERGGEEEGEEGERRERERRERAREREREENVSLTVLPLADFDIKTRKGGLLRKVTERERERERERAVEA